MRLLPDVRIAAFARNSRRCPAALAGAALCFLCIASSRAGEDTKTPSPDAAAPAAKPMFDKVGPQLGEQLPELRLRTLKGKPQNLGDAWHGGPALIVTSSFTCPKSRSRWPQLAAIEKRYGEKLNVVVVYVIEAHPSAASALTRAWKTSRRKTAATTFSASSPKRWRSDSTWRWNSSAICGSTRSSTSIRSTIAHGRRCAAPNIAFLVDERGIVAARQGWFDGPALQKAIDAF